MVSRQRTSKLREAVVVRAVDPFPGGVVYNNNIEQGGGGEAEKRRRDGEEERKVTKRKVKMRKREIRRGL